MRGIGDSKYIYPDDALSVLKRTIKNSDNATFNRFVIR
jgi:hypothetical protein